MGIRPVALHEEAVVKVLLTGSAGRIGRAIHARLRADGHDVVGLDVLRGDCTQVVASITDRDAVARALEGMEAVVHTAALHAPHVGQRSDADFMAINVAATDSLLADARAAGARRFVFTSTTALYGSGGTRETGATWVDVDTVPRPKTIYHRTKIAAEQAIRAAASPGFAVTILRMSRCFPEPAPIMAAYRLHRGVDARDVADAHAIALAYTGAEPQTFVISGDTPFAREDVAALMADAPEVLRRRAPELVREFEKRGWPLPASIDRVYDNARARARLNWRPRYGFREVLAQLDAGSPEVKAQGG